MSTLQTFGTSLPERDHFVVYSRKDGSLCAYHRTMDDHRLYVMVYGAKPAEIRWSYEAPEGAEVFA